MTMTRLFRIGRHRARALFTGTAVDEELSRELAFHFEHLVEEHVAAGLRPDAAREAARRALGSTAAIEDACRDHRRVTWLHDLRQDVAYAIRMLRINRGFAFVAISSIGLGIGAVAAVAGVALAVFAREIPVPSGDRIVVAQLASDGDFRSWTTRGTTRVQALEAAGASFPDERDLALAAGRADRGSRSDTGPVRDTSGTTPDRPRLFR
jgi:hypothetical protein